MSRILRGWLVAGLVAVLTACGGGGGGGSNDAPNNAPHIAAVVSGDVRTESGQLRATLGGTVRVDASTSTDADGDLLSFEWTLTAKPVGSNAVLSGRGAAYTWTPDALGSYTFSIVVTDSKGAKTTQPVTVVVDNRAPFGTVVVTPQFTPAPLQAPTQAVTVSSNVVLDATASADPDGDAVSVSFELVSKPAGSAASVTVAAKAARFSPDVMGVYKVRVIGTDASNASFESIYTFDANNRAPSPVVVSNAAAVTLNGGANTLVTSVGYDVLLDGSSSNDSDGDAITRAWTLTSRPPGSTAALTNATGATSTLSPDVLGDFVVTLTVTDTKGAKSIYTTAVRANNRRPQAQVGINATPAALPAAPGTLVPLGTQVTLRGDASTDADGDAITYDWSITARPGGSTAALSSGTATSPVFTPDTEGAYVFRLRVTDTAGAFSERSVTLQVGTHAPVAVVDRTEVTALLASTVPVSAAMSFDADGDTLSYLWSIDAKPAGSSAVLGNASSAAASLVPDVEGIYVLAVRVSDGRTSSIAYVTVRVLAQFRSSVTLNFKPDQALYSKGLDRMVIGSANPDTLRVVDAFTGVVASIPLPNTIKNMSLSPDGKLAVVLHEGLVSLVDLQASTVLRSIATGGAQTEAFVTNAGMIYAIGQTGGQWVGEPVVVLDGRTGAKVPQPGTYYGAVFYGEQYGVLASTLNKVLFMSQGLSPADLTYFSFDPATSQVTGAGDSPYHGDFAMSTPLFLSADESLVFTAAGTYFNTTTLRYAGLLSGVSSMVSFSHSAAQQEALALQATGVTVTYSSSYQRFTGPFLLPNGSLALPLVNGAQSYGINIFHSANGSHVGLVQTGGAVKNAAGLAYHVIVR